MMEIQCEICSSNCILQVEIVEEEVVDVTGNGCMRGYTYAQQEVVRLHIK